MYIIETESHLTDTHKKIASWCFKPSQPLRIISELEENFIKRSVVERTKKAEIRPEEQSEKAKSCQENLRNEIQLKGPQRQKQTQEQNTQEWASSAGSCLYTNHNIPTT